VTESQARRPEALLLDLDDTLLDHRAIPENIRNTCELVAAAFPAFDAAQLLEANTRAWAEYWPQVEKAAWLGGIEVETVSREAWRRTLHDCGSDDASIVEFTYERSAGSIARRGGSTPTRPLCWRTRTRST
jgi:hypothetical protein